MEFVDLYPTIADLCGLRMPHAGAGSSLRPILTDPSTSVRDAAFTLVQRGDALYGQSLRTTRWRMTRWSDGGIELYDHAVDPEELRDVSRQHPEVVAQLQLRMQSLPPVKAPR